MKSSTQLESAFFQLTPTRTRCDLVITANGKTEKIASGLVNPFLAHLKTAQDQMDKGGYSIILQPESGSDASWFTKATVERFVRFVSTPEILERVYTLESEILQIEEAIAIQSNNDIGLNLAEEHQKKSVERVEGNKPLSDSNDEKAIVLYEPGAHTPAANGSTAPEGNSKLQLMKVLETRKTALQKEQGMAFARAVAAGFDIDHMTPLVSFAESFGAQRLMDACMRFKGLWKRKHETGQWVEIEAAEEMSSRSDFSTINSSGIVFSNAVNSENNGKADEKASVDQQQLPSHQEYFQGQYPLPMYPPWPIHSPPGALPAFQGYPMQGIPYYQNYPGNGPMFQPPYPAGEDHKRRLRRHSMDSNIEPETWEANAKSQDDVDLERETFGGQEPGRKVGRSSKKQSGRVVIRNINYITSKKQDSSGSESQSASETDEDGNSINATSDMKRNDSVRSSKRKDNHASNEETAYGKEADGGQWQAFQTYLLKDADEAERAIDQNMFTMEKDVRVKRWQNTVADDPLLFNGRGAGENQEGIMRDIRGMSGNLTHMRKMTNDELLISRRTGQPSDGTSMDVESAELYRRRGGYRMTGNDEFLVHRKGEYGSPSDSLAINGFERANSNNRSSANANDDSYIVSLRSMSLHQTETDERNAFDMDSEFPSSIQRAENSSNNVGNQVKYEPDALSLMPERETEKRSAAYDPALDYEMEVHMDKTALSDKKNKVGIPDKQGSKKTDKDRKSRLVPGTSDKKTVGPIRKGKPSKLSPLDEARARAERLRTYKADLQKMKKEKEAEEMRRLEALKLERQKRIAARGSSSIAAQSATPQTKKQVPIKLSPSSHRASKFTDSEPGSSSPLQRSTVRTISAGSNDSLKASKSSKLTARSNSAGNRLTRSVSSLPEPKKDNAIATPDTKTSIARTRRLSEPTKRSSHQVSSVKPRSAEPVSKPKVSNGQESKKMSAIMNHDKSKASSLPELKIRSSKTLGILEGKSATKDLQQKENGSKSFTASEGTEPRSNRDKVSHHSDGDDNPIVEKTVVMLECEKPSVPTVCKSGGNVGVQVHSDSLKMADRHDTASEFAAIRAPVSQPTLDRVDRESIEHQRQRKPSDYAVITENASNPVKESPVFSSIDAPGKPYQAPYARVSSLEDQCTRNSEYGKAPAILQTETSPEILEVHISDSRSLKLERIPETSDRPQSKESSKGFRRLLKFGRKNHASADRNTESDNGNVNGSEADDSAADVGSSSEVHTLKNLISQDETPTTVTPQKTSRHFSLLSPFRSKTSEKKQTA